MGGGCTTIGLFGSMGKMGQIIQELVTQEFTNQDSESAFRVIPLSRFEASLPFSSPLLPDVLMDFSVPEAVFHHIDIAVNKSIPLLIGTTALCPQADKSIHQAGRSIPVLRTANTSLGSAVLEILAAKAATLLGSDFDIEICETHHRYKKDAPSGTALALGRAVSAARGISFTQPLSCDRNRFEKENEVGYAVMRGGGVVGDHSVHFLGENESVTLSHRGFSRVLFARGALKAAQWLKTQPPGVYAMTDFIKHSFSMSI